MVVIHLGIPRAAHRQIKPAMAGKQRQHMIQEAAAGIDLRPARAIQIDGQRDIGFRRLAADFGFSHACASFSISPVAAISASICSRVPMVMRT